MIWFPHHINIQHTIVLADDWHALVNKHTHKKLAATGRALKGPQYILLCANLVMPLAAQ